MPEEQRVDAVVVGAGFAGLYALHRLRDLGMSVRVFEAGSGVGGTWFWNRYPGARCDIESVDYSYSFDPDLEQEWEWTQRYAAQPEILAYLNHVADRFDLRRDITFDTRVTSAVFDEAAERWTVSTDSGELISARYCIMAAGCLSTVNTPDFPGLGSFEGTWYHTGRWPHEAVDFTGQRVAVIGTGSSGTQIIPAIADQAAELVVFQRTPNFSIPARNRDLDPAAVQRFKARYREHRLEQRSGFLGSPLPINEKTAAECSAEERREALESRWQTGGFAVLGAFADVLFDPDANDIAADFVREKIKGTVKDPAVAEVLTPTDYAIGTKRLCVDTDYYETFNRDNVRVVNLRATPIDEITPRGVRTGDVHHDFDSIVFATGFDAITGALLAIDIRGRDGIALVDEWKSGPRTYLGVAATGFPNLFMITGPGSPSVLSNMVLSIEQHVEWIANCLSYAMSEGHMVIEATAEAQDGWMAQVEAIAAATLFPNTRSWYTGANIPGKPRSFTNFLGGVGPYREICDAIAAKGYEGFAFE